MRGRVVIWILTKRDCGVNATASILRYLLQVRTDTYSGTQHKNYDAIASADYCCQIPQLGQV